MFLQQPKVHHAITIEIRSSASPVWRAAILSADPNLDRNVISQRLVTKVLGEPIHPINKETTDPIEAEHEESMKGYVDLDWCLEKDNKSIHRTRFLVTSIYNPPYDAVLGKEDARLHGMIKQRFKGPS